MPELPEMENYKILLSQQIINQPITHVTIEREKSINVPAHSFTSMLLGKKIVSISRRAKHLLFHLENNKVLLLHLMLGGSMFYGTKEEKPNRTSQVTLSFGDYHLYLFARHGRTLTGE
ncbi:DNA-formamidopyrimidine glycosylase family protein, partial [Bacillaceae bacterium S4-13-58]